MTYTIEVPIKGSVSLASSLEDVFRAKECAIEYNEQDRTAQITLEIPIVLDGVFKDWCTVTEHTIIEVEREL